MDWRRLHARRRAPRAAASRRAPAASWAAVAAPALAALALAALALLAAGCGPGGRAQTLATWPLDDLQGVIDADGVVFDPQLSADGRGSLLVEAQRPRAVRLFELTPPPGLENRLLVVRGQMRAVLRTGQAHLEMWVRVPGRDEYCGRDLSKTVTRSRNFHEVGAQLRLEKGMVPDRIRINLVVEGVGSTWLDDLELAVEPLPKGTSPQAGAGAKDERG